VAAWAMNFVSDGDVSDWSGIAPLATDPGNDATDGTASVEVLAGFAAVENDRLFLRMDVADLENMAPVAIADAFSVDEDMALNVTAPGVLANDTDAELDPLTAVLASGPASAQSFTLNADGSFDYTPNADFNGSDSFTYFANDGQANSAVATATITVNAVNDAPLANPAAANTDEDNAVTITLSGSDVENYALTFAIVTAPANGSLGAITPINDTSAEVVFTPNADFNGNDSFTYTSNDGALDSAPALVSVTINAVNDVPEFTSGPDVTVDEDSGAQTIAAWATGISAGPADEAGQMLTFNVTGNTNAALFDAQPAVNAAGDLAFTPSDDANGNAMITLTLSDDGGTANGGVDTSVPQSFTIMVTAINDPPTADDAAASTDEDMAVLITLSGSDVEGDALSFAIVTAPVNGSLGPITQITPTTAQVSYTPNADFNGADAFTFISNDGTADSVAATISLTVNPINAPPMANSSMATTVEDTPVTITLTGSDVDGDGLTFAIASGPSNGMLGAIVPLTPNTAEVSYTPSMGFSGADSFAFTASDGMLTTAATLVAITVTPGNTPPVANSAATSTNEDAPLLLTLTGSDVDGDTLAFAIATGPTDGMLSSIVQVTPTSAQLTYTPTGNFAGADSFTFTVNDGTVASPAATVSLTVNPVNDPPSVVTHTLTTHSAIQITLGASDSELLKDGATDIDDPSAALTVQPLAATSVNGALLTLINPATGTYSYDPPGGFTGADSFTYEVCDSATTAAPVECASGTVNVTVTGPPLWVVNPAAAAGGDGSLNRPLQALSGLPGARASGARIFLFSGNNPAGHIFLANERLIGQGASGNSFDGFLGVQIPGNGTLDARPAVAGTRPVVQGQVTLAAGVTAQGFNIAPPAATPGLFGNGGFSGITVNQMSVSTANAAAVSLTGVTGNFTLTRVDANGGANGIVLDNTGASGSFQVSGDGSNARNGSGGTIQNTTGDGVLLTNASNVTLRSMNLVNVGDSFDSGAGGNNLGTNDHAIQSQGGGSIVLSGVFIDNPAAGGWEAENLGGVNRIDNNSRIENVDVSNMQALEVRNTNTNMTSFTIDDSEFADQASSNGSSYVLFQSIGSSVMSVFVGNNSLFEQLFGVGIQANAGAAAGDNGTVNFTVQTSTFRDAVDGTVGLGATGGLGGIVGTASQNARINYGVNGNTLNDLGRPLANSGVVIFQGIGGTGKTLDGTFDANVVSRIGYPTAAAATGSSMVGHRVIDIVTENNINFLDHESDMNEMDDTSREAFFVSSRDSSQDFDISITNNMLGQTTPIGSTNREVIEMLSEDSSDMEAIVSNNMIMGNTSALDQVVDIDIENTSFMDMRFNGNTVANAQAAGGLEVVVDTENGTSNHCMQFLNNTAVDVEFDVNAAAGGHRIEDFANVVANNPGVTNFIDGVGVTSVTNNSCQVPTF